MKTNLSEMNYSIRPYATQNIHFPCLGMCQINYLKSFDHSEKLILAGFGHSQNIDLIQNGNKVLADETIVWPTDYEIRQDFETFFLLEK